MMGESGVVSIKVMTNKFTGEPAGYGFINFDSDQTAIIAMHRMGGKVRRHRNLFLNCFNKLHFTFQIIPNSNPPVRFKLNHNSTRLAPGEVEIDWRKQNYEKCCSYLPPQIDTSIWVGDLTPEVDDFALYRYFTQRYGTVRCAKVQLDSRQQPAADLPCTVRWCWTSPGSARDTAS